jgi:alkylated DNA repair dioxygenase AlkB
MPSNLGHNPWDMSSDGPSLTKALIQPAVKTQVYYHSNYKVIRYTIEGVVGSVTVAKANKHVVSEPGGANDMFRELQTVNVGLERRIMRKTADTEQQQPPSQHRITVESEDTPENANEDQPGEAGARMTAFGMNFGMPYKFIATGDSKSSEDAPTAVRAVRSRLNWAQRVFVNDESGYQDFNEELIFAYLEGQKIKYHDDGEEGLGPRIATLSLGAPATMDLRVKAKYFSQVSKTGVFTDEKPLPLPLLESCGWASGYTSKAKDAALQASKTVCKDTHVARLAAWAELQDLRAKGDMKGFRTRSKELPAELQMKRKEADTLLSFHLTHGDIVIMEGDDIQKFLEHAVEPHGHLRFAMTCRTILPSHLPPDQLPPYEVLPDAEGYDGSAIREEGDGDRQAVVWE